MKRILTCCAVLMAGVVGLSVPKEAGACSACDTERPKCNDAVNSRCAVYASGARLITCEQYYTSCAYVYTPAEVSADGSIVRVAASPNAKPDAEQVRGCHGLIVKRAYPEGRQEQARAASRQIVL